MSRRLLALDLGDACGWALRSCGGTLVSGSTSFAARRNAPPGQRFANFAAWLSETFANNVPHVVYFEKIQRHAGTDAAHVYGGFMATLQVWCIRHEIECVGVHWASVKKDWTGKGNADKDAMMRAAVARGLSPQDHNEADALAVLSYAELSAPEMYR